MNHTLKILALIALAAPAWAADEVPVPASAAGPLVPTLFIGPSSTSLSLGKANLVIGELKHKAGACLGNYQLKVSPFSFKNETGSISMTAAEGAFSRLARGIAVSFTGKAVTNGTGECRAVTAKATPTSKDCGNVSFSFRVDAGTLVFNAPYRLGGL